MAKRGVALCITDLDMGGAEQAMVDLATRLEWIHFEPIIYCLGPRPQVEEASCVPALEDAGLEVQFLDAQSAWQFQPTVRRLEALFRKQRPALVQSFLFHANLVSRLAARRAGVARVVAGVRVAERRRWHLWADRLTSSLVDRYVCVSDAVARHSARRGGLAHDKLVVIPNGIDVTKYTDVLPVDLQMLGATAGRRLVTYIGRLDGQKGVHWLIKTAPRWLSRLPDCDLLIVGKGPQQARLEASCQRLGIAARVHFVGWRPDIAEILATSHLLVLPSRWEGMPNVVLQAMASRLPVVASDAEGVRELLGPEADAQVVRYGDSQAFAEKVVKILCDQSVAADLGSKNRLRAESEFTLERVVAAYQSLWTSLLDAG
jgi:glycosyltransferase involved in cell wall biosynthesis